MSKRMVEADCCDIGECVKEPLSVCAACKADLCQLHRYLVAVDFVLGNRAAFHLCPQHSEELLARYKGKEKPQEG